MNATMRTVHLHGDLAEKYGETFRFAINSAFEMGQALICARPEIRKDFMRGKFHIVRGSEMKREKSVGQEMIQAPFGSETEIHLIPAIEGAGNGTLKTIFGVVLIVVGIYTSNPGLIAMGVGSVAGGISQMLASTPAAIANQGPQDQRPSFLFSNQVNVNSQGGPVPLVFGRFRTGSVVINAGITEEQL